MSSRVRESQKSSPVCGAKSHVPMPEASTARRARPSSSRLPCPLAMRREPSLERSLGRAGPGDSDSSYHRASRRDESASLGNSERRVEEDLDHVGGLADDEQIG